MAITATLYHPGRPPEVLDAARRSLLSITQGAALSAHTRTVAAYLKVPEVDLLYADPYLAVWGRSDAADVDCPANPAADEVVAEVCPSLPPLVGPILLIVNE